MPAPSRLVDNPVAYRPLSYLEWNARRRPAAPAIYEDGETIGFEDFFWRVQALMGRIADLGVGPGQVVAVSLPNTWQYVAAEIAVPALGAVIMPLAPSLGRYEVESALSRSGATLVLADSETSELVAKMTAQLPALGHLVDVADLDLALQPAKPLTAHPSGPADVVQIALTSGTTGPPKLAALPAELKQLTFEGYTTRLAITEEDRVLPLSPISQGVGEMSLYALRRGACLVMAHERRFSPGRDLRLAADSKATVLTGVPTMFGRLLHHTDFASTDLGALRLTAVAGSPLAPELAESWETATGSRVCGFYGAMDIGQLAVASPDDPPRARWHSVGRPHETAELLVCDADGKPVARGENGELCMRGPLVQSHYWGEVDGPYSPDGWAHFGDLGYVDDDGYVHVVGRTKDTIIRGGDNINPYQVEAVLSGHPDIAEACLVEVADADLGGRPVAFVVARPGHRVSFESVLEFLQAEGLARYKWPEQMAVVAELPLGSSGKVSRSELRRRAAASFDAAAPGKTPGKEGDAGSM